MRSVGKISSALLSVSDTGTPEFVSRIYIPWLAWAGEGRKHRRAFQGASGVFGLTSLPERSGKPDNALLSASLNLSMSKISGTTWEVGTYSGVSG